jgi:hypothetical protein
MDTIAATIALLFVIVSLVVFVLDLPPLRKK